MRAVLSFLMILAVSQFGFAKANFDGLSDSSLRSVLEQVASQGHHAVSYKTAKKELFGRISLEQESGRYLVHDAYCDVAYTNGVGPGKLPNNSAMNTEHTWPQSKFGGRDKGSQKSDLHHLFPTDAQMNATRGNFAFGEVAVASKTLKCPASAFGRNSQGQQVFEPPTNHRGNVARALFYFSVRYGMKIDPTQEAVLKKWHDDDPVDQDEVDRNDAIEMIQGNRNPFIDNPELSYRISDF